MNPQFARYGTTMATNVSPIVLVFVSIASILILFVPRKYIFAPLFFAWFFIPLGQRVVVGGLNFMMFRIVILAAVCRAILMVFSGGELTRFRWNQIDKVFILWGLSSLLTFTLLYGQWEAFVNHLGLLYNAFGVYFALRIFYSDARDVDRTIRIFAIICAVIAVCMSAEQFTSRNFFYIFGGVPQFTDIREGQLRSQGPFAHPILAGTFGATMVPLFLGLWFQKSRSRVVALLGVVSGAIITITASSSTAVMAMLIGAFASFLWPIRRRMRFLRWGMALTLIGLHLIMKAPVWALIGRMDVIGSSSGYHRYFLVDNFIRRFWEWWLVGTKETGSWGYDMWDTANQYVDTGVSGGLLTFVLFLAIIVCCFKALGRARKAGEGNLTAERRLWTMGATLVAHLAAFFGITYFDQTSLAWYSLLAMISSLSTFALIEAAEPATIGTSYKKHLGIAESPLAAARSK